MAWNNGLERMKFDKEQNRLAEEYRIAGMTEEQIEQMYQFDLEAFNNTRRFFEHNQQIPDNTFGTDSEGLCPLYNKFLEPMSVTAENSGIRSRYWWIEELENPYLAIRLKALSKEDIDIITLYAFEGFTQCEISEKFGFSQKAISKRIEKFRRLLDNLV